MLRSSLIAASTVALVAWAVVAQPNMRSTIKDLDESCELQLNALWTRYTNASEPIEECDPNCLSECKQTLLDALYATTVQNCPTQADIQRCFRYQADAWESYTSQCALFKFGAAAGDLEVNTGAEGEAESASTTPSTSTSAESEAEAESEAGRRRSLLQEAEGESEGAPTGVASDVAGGCFPPFADIQEFEKYITCEWVFETKSNGVGVALSVLFFMGLAVLGVTMKG